MNSKPRRKYDQDFKRNAVLLCSEPGKSVTQVAENLGITKDLLYRWRREYHRTHGQYVFPGNGIEALTPDQKRTIPTICRKERLKNWIFSLYTEHNGMAGSL